MNPVLNSSNNNQESSKPIGYKITTTTIKQQRKFLCRANEFYNVMTTPEVCRKTFKGYSVI